MPRGRPRVAECDRRVTQTLRLSRYVSDWLDHQKGSSGRIIENALVSQYDIHKEGDDVQKQRLEEPAEELIPALDGAIYHLAVMAPEHGGGMAILDSGRWRRVDMRELEMLAQNQGIKNPRY